MGKLKVSILRLRDFRLMLLTRMLAAMALQSQAVIVGWQVYSLTKDPFMLGLTGLTEAIPALTCALFAGHVVDISRPYRVYLVCLLTLVLNTTALLLIAGGYVHVPASALLTWIFSGIFISGVARSFMMPSSFSLLPQLVPRTDIPAASAWLSGGFQIATIAAPAVAGIVYGGYGSHIAWLLPAALMILSLLMASGIRGLHHFRNSQKRPSAIKNIAEGWKFIFRHRILLPMMTLDMFAVLFGGAVAMLPAYADLILHVGAEGLGALRAAPAVGAIVTAIIMAVRPMKKIAAVNLLWVVAGFGLCMIGFGLSTSFVLSMLLLALSGAFDSVSMIIRGTIVQLVTPDAMRGRVSAVNSMFIISSNEIGAFESGVAARFLGLVPSVVLGGIGTLLVVAVTALLSPRLRETVVNPEEGNPS